MKPTSQSPSSAVNAEWESKPNEVVNRYQPFHQAARRDFGLPGVSGLVGLARCAPAESAIRNGPRDPFWESDCTKQTPCEIEEKVRKILDEAHAAAQGLLHQYRDQLDRLAGEVLEGETMDGATFRQSHRMPVRSLSKRSWKSHFMNTL